MLKTGKSKQRGKIVISRRVVECKHCLVVVGIHESVLEVDQGYVFMLQMFQIALNCTLLNASSVLCEFYLN